MSLHDHRKTGASLGISDDIVRELRDAVVVRPQSRPARSVVPEPAAVPVDPFAGWARSTRNPVPIPSVRSSSVRTFFSLVPWLVGAGIVITGLLYVSHYGVHLKAQVVQRGNAAIGHLEAAKTDLERMNFGAAQGDFTNASEQFDNAHNELGLIGGGLGQLLSYLPGGGQIKAARNLITAGQLLSQAGASLAKAVATLAQSGALLDPADTRHAGIAQIMSPIKDALSQADGTVKKASGLLAEIDPTDLPDQAQQQLKDFVERLPQVEALIGKGNDAMSFFNGLIGADHPKRYLLLFQNSSELRPTGGFPGSYGLVTFDQGQLRDMTADDIYNPDGQLRQLIIPPQQLQHITPSWGMRDANWFVDFPTSARKVMELYRSGGGAAVDGVIAIRPEVIAEILRITGPISLPQYDLVLDADHFIPLIQLEVESKKTPEPKKIIMDLAPLLLAKLAALPPDQWAKVLDMFSQDLTRRDVLMYMHDADLQSYVAQQGWDGGVVQTTNDYLTVNISNIKGAKEDAVTDTTLKLESWLQDGTLVHRLTLARTNNGGHTDYGFYNKTNYSYVRVLVPKGSTLRGIIGNDHPNNRPLMDYLHASAVADPDLVALESTYHYDAARDATTSTESGKTGFGFWMKIDPGQTQSVQLEYVIPASAASSDYHLYVQRQPGLDISDFEFTLQKDGVSGISNAQPPLTTWPDSWRLHDPLQQDLDLVIHLQ